MMIDPTDYAIAVEQAQAAADQARSDADNAEREAERRANLTTLETSKEEKIMRPSGRVRFPSSMLTHTGWMGISKRQISERSTSAIVRL
jgi:multidrug resistance efflux pump